MKKPKLIFLLFTIVIGHSLNTVHSQSINNTARRNNAFAFQLYKNVFNKESNTFISPYGISSALAMTYAGAKKKLKSK